MLARSARQASLSVGASADAETSATENRRKLTASESRPLTRPSPSALLVAGSRKFRGSQDAIGPPRHACCKSRNLAVGPGDEAVIQLCLFLRTAPSYFPSNSNARFPRRPSASAVASFVQPPPRRGSGAPTGALFLSSCRARARRDARACEARTCPGATGTPLGAPPWRFSAADPRWRLRQWNTGAAATARARPYCLAVGVRTSRGAVSRRSRGTRLLAPSAGRLRRRPLLSQDGNLVQ
jgi:hypothetical protein